MRVLVVGALVAAGVLLPSSTAHAASTCNGLAATVVGQPGTKVRGTEGNDVIVAADPAQVQALGGDDTVCVTGTELLVDLGAGADVFLGGDGGYSVYTGDEDDVAAGRAPSYDVVRTGSSDDWVYSGAQGTEDHDDLELGWGHDTIELRSVPRGRYVADGTPGTDPYPQNDEFNDVRLDLDGRRAYRFDMSAGTLTVDGATVPLKAFTQVEMLGTHWSSLAYVGTAISDNLGASDTAGNGPVDVALAGGPDVVALAAGQLGPVDAGTGRDALAVTDPRAGKASGRLIVDLARGHRATRAARAARQPTTGFEDLEVTHVATVRAWGTDVRNSLQVFGCTVELHGRAGNDHLVGQPDRCGRQPGQPPGAYTTLTARLFGGPGDDRLQGAQGDDVLRGGPGRDRADGLEGRDLCEAERAFGCELGSAT